MPPSENASIEPLNARSARLGGRSLASISEAATRRESLATVAFFALGSFAIAGLLLTGAIGISYAFVYQGLPAVGASPWHLGSLFYELAALTGVTVLGAAALGWASSRAEASAEAAHDDVVRERRGEGPSERGLPGLDAIRDELAERATRDLPPCEDSVLSRDSAAYVAFPDLGKYARYFSILGRDGTAIRCVVADSVESLDLAVADIEERVAQEGGLLRPLTYQQRHWWLEGGAPFFPAVPPARANR